MKTYFYSIILVLLSLVFWHGAMGQNHAKSNSGIAIAAAQNTPSDAASLQMAATNFVEQSSSSTTFKLPEKL